MNKIPIFNSWPFYHILFWVITILQFGIDIIEYAPYDFTGYVLSIVIHSLLIAALMYLHQLVLIPYLLRKGNYLIYIIFLVIDLVVFTYFLSNTYFITTNDVIELPIRNACSALLKYFVGIRYLIISGLFAVLQNWFEQEKKLSQIKIDKLATELNFLRAQINPHFLFNTLNNLYGLALKKSDKTPELILRLSDIMEYMVYDSNDIKLLLRKDIDHLINYLELEKIRLPNDVKLEYHVEGYVTDQKIVPLLLLPLVENGIKHGLNVMTHNAFLIVKLEVNDSNLTLFVKNSKSVVSGTVKVHRGMGLSNIESRLDTFYFAKHRLTILDDTEIYQVELNLDLS